MQVQYGYWVHKANFQGDPGDVSGPYLVEACNFQASEEVEVFKMRVVGFTGVGFLLNCHHSFSRTNRRTSLRLTAQQKKKIVSCLINFYLLKKPEILFPALLSYYANGC
jgi:hypothetical protein